MLEAMPLHLAYLSLPITSAHVDLPAAFKLAVSGTGRQVAEGVVLAGMLCGHLAAGCARSLCAGGHAPAPGVRSGAGAQK